jgi:dipeptide/tripeptide permease
MNIIQLGQGSVEWWVAFAFSIGGTAIVVFLIWLGKKFFKRHRQNSLNKGWKSRYRSLREP